MSSSNPHPPITMPAEPAADPAVAQGSPQAAFAGEAPMPEEGDTHAPGEEQGADLESRTEEYWGTVYASGREVAFGGIEQSRSVYWTEADEAAYLERVKSKASAMASELLAKAQAEVADIREAARQEGYTNGLAEAKEELEVFRTSIAENVASVLSAIEGQCTQVFRNWQDDIVGVARLAVEKATAITISEERTAVLRSLIEQSLSALEDHRIITLCVHPEDEPAITDIMQSTTERRTDIGTWKVVADASITPGGLKLDTGSSMAQSTVESRLAAVDSVLRHLSLPEMP
ncbi:FliH/SctL family protein [Desulfovibrio cuneatus]|uniref:FliH/SctL family protein n=1 Tax=Desulfovibrio cuneatus TaxID=159728 RepID=UPI0004063A44|nr:FliH/SctL family protein [Desulfovibrio cuneatus]